MKRMIEDFYYLFFPRDEEGVYKDDIDSPLWVKILILLFIALMMIFVAIVS